MGSKFCPSRSKLTTMLHGHYFLSLPHGDEAGDEADGVEDQANDEVDSCSHGWGDCCYIRYSKEAEI